MNLPNKLSILRIILIPVFTAFFFLEVIPFNYLIATAVFGLAAFTDFLDGKIARKYNLITTLGNFLDTTADKLLVGMALILLAVNPTIMYGAGIIPATLCYICFTVGVAIILLRDLMIMGLKTICASNNVIVVADKLGKIKAFLTDIAIVFLLIGLDLPGLAKTIVLIIGYALFVISVIMTIVSAINYIIKNKQIFSENK